MDDDVQKVTSELYAENDYTTNIPPNNAKNVVSKFLFNDIPHSPKKDSDGDLDLVRKTDNDFNNTILIEHSQSTVLNQVGLQIWRGALLLADWLIYNGKSLPDGHVLELGSGVGLTSIVASLFKPVICTDIDVGGLLQLIENNVARNKSVTKHQIKVVELDFMSSFNEQITNLLSQVQIVLAADVVYDDRLTEAFVKTVEKVLAIPPKKTIYVALEKRYVFTVADLETCAPCYEYFKECLHNLKSCRVVEVPVDFPQYFKYERVKDLVLWQISS